LNLKNQKESYTMAYFPYMDLNILPPPEKTKCTFQEIAYKMQHFVKQKAPDEQSNHIAQDRLKNLIHHKTKDSASI